jgi:nucleotide-binding universal stress UspA family protein
MEKREIQVAGYTITQLDETEYEAANEQQKLDFHFDTGNPAAVEVFIFDSDVPTEGEQDPCITAFYAEDLEAAVRQAMTLTRRSLEGSERLYNVVERLREVSRRLEADPRSGTKTVLFPGWHEEFEGDREELIREAARAILAAGVEPDEGTHVSQKAVAALIHYIADMME